MEAIAVQELSKLYPTRDGSVHALQQVSFSFSPSLLLLINLAQLRARAFLDRGLPKARASPLGARGPQGGRGPPRRRHDRHERAVDELVLLHEPLAGEAGGGDLADDAGDRL